MERYIAHARAFESGETLRSAGIAKKRNEIPSPKVRHVTTWRSMEESRWSPDEYEAWLFATLKEQLLPRRALHP